MKLRLIALAAFMFSLTSCFDVVETFNISDNGSGTYEVKMDMSQLIAFGRMMGGGKNTDKVPEKKDSTIYFSVVTDTASTLTNAEKAAFRKATAKIHVDEEASEMWVQLFYPYATVQEFTLIQDVLSRGDASTKAVFGALDKAMGRNKSNPMGVEEVEAGSGGSLPTKEFIYSLTNGSLERKLNAAIKKEKDSEDVPDEFKGMIKMNYTTIINLPRAVKSWTGNNGVLSDDKKQLKFSKEMDMGTALNSEEFAFTVQY
jgi:hypothetical protein